MILKIKLDRIFVFFAVFLVTFYALKPSTYSNTNSQNETNNQVPDPTPIRPDPHLRPGHLVIMGDGEAFSNFALVADKSKRTLSLWQNKNQFPELVDFYPMDIGKAGGDKLALGDHKTPEGIYFPQEMLDGNKVNFELYGVRIFTLNYPNFFDRLARKTGYGIWLHAVPDTQSLLRGSRGCVVVRNEIIIKLSPFITLKKTPVIIVDQVEYVTDQQIKKNRKDILEWLDQWRTAWAQKNIEKYMQFYHSDFRSQRMNKDLWRTYKDSLNKRYENISVEVSKPVFFTRNSEGILNFMQKYESSGLKDFGRKTLYLRRDNESALYKILGEEWAPESGGLLADRPEEAAREDARKAKSQTIE